MKRCNHFPCAFDCPDAPWNQQPGLMTKRQILRRYCEWIHQFGMRAWLQCRSHMWWLYPGDYDEAD